MVSSDAWIAWGDGSWVTQSDVSSTQVTRGPEKGSQAVRLCVLSLSRLVGGRHIRVRVGIAGFGVIGKATASVFADVVIYDPLKGFPDAKPLGECGIVFVCVPTPTRADGQDLSFVRQCLRDLSPALGESQVVALRSTVLPGTNRQLQKEHPRLILASNPEFLRSHRAMDDMREPYRVIIGADQPQARRALVEAYSASLVVDVRRRFTLTDTITAELIKYAANCYLATKISYFNEMYDVCQSLGADYETLRTALGLDPRIAPGEETMINPRNRGFDDECLPKDLRAFITFLVERGFPATMFQGTEEVNHQVRSSQSREDIELPRR
jgi:UDPglucose 6-dehydrogenase